MIGKLAFQKSHWILNERNCLAPLRRCKSVRLSAQFPYKDRWTTRSFLWIQSETSKVRSPRTFRRNDSYQHELSAGWSPLNSTMPNWLNLVEHGRLPENATRIRRISANTRYSIRWSYHDRNKSNWYLFRQISNKFENFRFSHSFKC